MIEYHVIVKGLVQGVCFRATTKERAEKYHVVGSVTNESDGTVKIIAQGEKEVLKDFLESLKKDAGHGKVESMAITEKPVTKSFGSFDITY